MAKPKHRCDASTSAVGRIRRRLTLTSLIICLTLASDVESVIKTMGGGESMIFTGTTAGETQEVRTPAFGGFESFTISMWIKNVSPGISLYGTDVGYPGSLWSYWLLSDGPSVGSGWRDKRAKGREVLQSIPLFSVYMYNQYEVILQHNDTSLSLGMIPRASGWYENTYYHYVFTYDGPNREINKYQDASFCVNQAKCENAVERSNDNAGASEYLQGLASTRVEPGMFRFGQSELAEPTLTMDLDDICIFNKSMSLEEAANIMDFGCDSVSGLVLNYDFNQRRTQSPDLYDTVSGTFNGISRPYFDMGDTTPSECAVDTESVDTCQAALVPATYKGELSQRLQLDFGADIGPVRSNQGAKFSVTGKLNILRAAQYESEHIVTVQPVCVGQCRRFVVVSLPREGELCWDSPEKTGNWTCDPARVIVNGTVVPLQAGHDDPELEDWVDRSATPIYYLPHGNSTAGTRDTFNLVADSLQLNNTLAVNDTFESTALLVQIITNTPPIARDFTFEIAEGAFDRYYFPKQSEFLDDPDGGRENIEAEIVRTEINTNSSNPPVLLVYDCYDCDKWSALENGLLVDIQQGNNQTSTVPSYRINDPHRRAFLQHVDGTGSGAGAMTIVYRLFDQFDYSQEAKVTLDIGGRNKPPAVLPGFANTLEDSGDVLVEFNNLTSDVEGDIPLWRVDELPAHGTLHQLNTDGSKGDEVKMTSASDNVQQWTNGSMPCTSTSAWGYAYDCNVVDGPPRVYPLASDALGTYSPNYDWTKDPVILVLYLSEPVYLAELAFYFTWGPGGVVSIETQPYGDPDGPWEVVYEGLNTMSSHCVEQTVSVPCAAINRFRLCPKPYTTNKFRVVMTVDSTDRWICLDTVLSQGTRVNDAAIVTHPQGKLIWTPDTHFTGNDTFKFVADDCPAFLVLQMPPLDRLDTQQGEFTTSVLAVNDAPVVIIDASTALLTLGTDTSIFYEIPLSILDVDNAATDLSFTVNTLPEFGTLWVDEWMVQIPSTQVDNIRKGTPVLIETGTSLNFTRQVLLFQASHCTDNDLMPEVAFQVTVFDTSGAQSNTELLFSADCTNLPQIWEVDRPSDGSIAFGLFASLLGLVMVVFAIVFNLRFRKHSTIRMSSYRINILLFIGCSFIYLAILSMSVAHLLPSCFKGTSEGRVQGNSTTDLTTSDDSCIHYDCFSNIWLLDIGAALAWGSLYAKTYRIHYLFSGTMVRKKAFPDARIAKQVVKLVLFVILTLLVVCIYIGTPSLIFTPGTAQLSDTENAKLVTVVSHCSGDSGYDLLVYLSVAGFTLLQLFSAQIAYNVRNIELKQANDSQQIAFAIYTSLMIGLPGLGVASVVPSSDLSFVLVTFSIFLATTVVLLSMLLPRINDVYHNNKVAALSKSNQKSSRGVTVHEGAKGVVEQENVKLRLEVNELRKKLGLKAHVYASSVDSFVMSGKTVLPSIASTSRHGASSSESSTFVEEEKKK